MRVVGGELRGRRLQAPTGRTTRPTSDRVREAIFDMLASRVDLDGAVVVDLFAGSGALGIEALSRGATRATFVDDDAAAVAAIHANLAALDLQGDARSRVVRGDAVRNAPTAGHADVVLADPPYAFEAWPELLAALDADLAVLESGSDFEVPPSWAVLRRKRYGSTVVSLLQPTKGHP